MKRKVVGIASLPDRQDCLRDTIFSLINQVDTIIVALNNYNSVPTFLNHNKIKTHLLDNSLGDSAKFYKVDDYKNDFYFACDDDIIYPGDYCNRLIEKSILHKSIVGLHGIQMKKTIKSYYKSRNIFHCLEHLDNDTQVDFVGTGACLIDTSLLKINLSDFKLPNMADIWLADISKKQNVKSIAIQRDKNWLRYNDKMIGKWTIFDHFQNNSDKVQTNIVLSWS